MSQQGTFPRGIITIVSAFHTSLKLTFAHHPRWCIVNVYTAVEPIWTKFFLLHSCPNCYGQNILHLNRFAAICNMCTILHCSCIVKSHDHLYLHSVRQSFSSVTMSSCSLSRNLRESYKQREVSNNLQPWLFIPYSLHKGVSSAAWRLHARERERERGPLRMSANLQQAWNSCFNGLSLVRLVERSLRIWACTHHRHSVRFNTPSGFTSRPLEDPLKSEMTKIKKIHSLLYK